MLIYYNKYYLNLNIMVHIKNDGKEITYHPVNAGSVFFKALMVIQT